jgi:hypothetical protein
MFLALMFLMGAFVLPTPISAASNVAPPDLSASITGNALRIEVAEGFFGVEAVYINEKRFNYRVDDVLIVDARDYVGDGKLASVYAVDFAGNKSNVVWLDNPFYTEPASPVPSTAAESPQKPFTPDGQASVLDEAAETDGKDFYTFTTQAGSVFHLIIDHQRNADNVYFLNAITENDLMAIAEKSDNTGISAIPDPTPTPAPEKPAETESPPEPEPVPAPKGNNSTMIIVIIGVAVVGGVAYYLKIVKPRQQGADDDENEGDGEDDKEYEEADEGDTEDGGE